MTGSSLWLLPPTSHPLHPLLTTLIRTTLPWHFPRETSSTSPDIAPHYFAAHVTLTSGIDPAVYGNDPQAWLDGLPFDFFSSSSHSLGGEGGEGGSGREGVRVRFERVVSQDVFFRRCFVRVGFGGDVGVGALAGVARARAVVGEEVKVVKDGGRERVEFGGETEKWLREWREEYGPHLSLMYGDEPLTDETLKEVTKVVQEAGVKLTEEDPQGSGLDGWEGGVIWLVPTDRPIAEWKPIATRNL